MIVKDYKNGIVHIKTSVGGSRIDVMRIDASKAKPYVIGSSFGGLDPASKGFIEGKRKSRSVKSLNTKYRLNGVFLENSFTSSRYGRKLKILWMSNGTFFSGVNEEKTDLQYINGPIVMDGIPIADILSSMPINKRSRWYYALKNGKSFYGQATGGKTSNQFKNEGFSYVIGGGAPLIINGVVISDSYPKGSRKKLWVDTLGFDDNQPIKPIGPIIASNNGDITYLIFAPGFSSWQTTASYLHEPSKFLKDIGFMRDGQVFNAVVYDGGGSPQLWIKGSGLLIPNSRAVPHRICLWGF